MREIKQEDFAKTSVISSNKKIEKRVGCYVGKFLPPHIGHISVIEKALSECDEVVIVISENPSESERLCRESNFPYFSSNKRLEWIKKHYNNQSNMEFYVIDESELKIKPKSMKEYAELFYNTVKTKVNVKYADESYRELNEKYFKDCEFVSIDRDKINIHGTDIRNDLSNLKYVIKEARKDILAKLNSES